MTYDDISSAYFGAPPSGVVDPALPETPARRLRDALEPIATHGWWGREPMTRLSQLGLGFFEAYVWGRAAALGTPASSLVVATFGVFEPGLLGGVYEHGRSLASRDDVLAARADGASAGLASIVDAGTAGTVADALLRVTDTLDGMARPLFSALRELPVPASPQGRLWRAAELVREHRGDGHLAVMAAAGLDAVESNVVTELWLGYGFGDYSRTRGWSDTQLGTALDGLRRRGWVEGTTLTPEGVRAREGLEHMTDETQRQLVQGLGSGVEALIASASTMAERVLRFPAFPADPRKRAAG